ncbi:Protein N-acetyltransferase, RimJ/RimL family [Dethiosulfatibacter aminovorans DSM 17477]|uniref:Protein N-acetyltransferase, RimJ/RimL family n=1 Tax=Dethiosulfatibacter aminovorans DSM 17477 TaxID=1121476 RepID=A0A1M6M6M1_9FIRM|nr:GNAT family protein [Dethiosulfatibacter aminovorans]SHJ79098.1 Protein N-acetyltransferase, RimJ/RimL family [Dethiosulfatibacter aminovorans DSM 17477]
MNLIGKRVILRALEIEDMEYLREMLNDPEMESAVIGWSFPTSKYEQEQWYKNMITDKNNLKFAIQSNEGELIGLATLGKIDWKNRKATHGIKLGKNTPKGQGYATDAVMAVMKYAFEELQLNRLDGSWFENNIASQNLYIKCGWVIEGKVRKSIYKNNEYRNEVIVGILREEYYQLINDLNV